MNNKHDDTLEAMLSAEVPPADNEARQKAMAMAMAEFSTAHEHKAAMAEVSTENISQTRQGNAGLLRLIRNTNHTLREIIMAFTRNQKIMGGMATCAVAVIAVLLVKQPASVDQLQENQPKIVRAELKKLASDMPAPEPKAEPKAEPAPIAEKKPVLTGVPQEVAKAKQSAVMAMKDDAASMRHLSGNLRSMPKAEMVMVASPAVSSESVSLPPAEYRDRFDNVKENTVKQVSAEPVSTFSIDVDTASYSFVRRNLNNGYLPAKDAVRTEEMINYFDYDYALPAAKEQPFQPNVAVTDSPWKAGNKLLSIGIKGYELPQAGIPDSNLVFLLDVSGSMNAPDKLPLVQQSMGLLLDTLKPTDTVAIVVYAGAAGTVLEPTPVREKQKILSAINNLQAGGSTAGAQGIERAYQLAEANFNAKGVNRIILATDGDFNVGPTSDTDLKGFVERKRDKGIYLSVLGFGQGNYQDALMQALAQNGNGIAAYIDTLGEAQKVLVHEATSTLFPIANDVKIQVEFNPATVAEYRLIGYETRALNREDFSNDKVDAGDIGAGHTVTALYEITPIGGNTLIEKSRYEQAAKPAGGSTAGEYAFVRIRYKLPGATASKLIERPVTNKDSISLQGDIKAGSLQQEMGFATAVAGFAQILKGSHYIDDFSHDDVITLAQKTKGKDEFGYRTEFIQLVRKAKLAKEGFKP